MHGGFDGTEDCSDGLQPVNPHYLGFLHADFQTKDLNRCYPWSMLSSSGIRCSRTDMSYWMTQMLPVALQDLASAASRASEFRSCETCKWGNLSWGTAVHYAYMGDPLPGYSQDIPLQQKNIGIHPKSGHGRIWMPKKSPARDFLMHTCASRGTSGRCSQGSRGLILPTLGIPLQGYS